jgi:ubiquinone/menaquinone biosynthesis C-methylase UbiE
MRHAGPTGVSGRCSVVPGSASWSPVEVVEGGMDETALSAHAVRARTTYSAAADHYDLPALSFWDRFGQESVARVPVREGQRVVDLCCGSGASALVAARAVGPTGHVTGIDVAEGLLSLAREKAAAEGLGQITFVHGDATDTGLPGALADAVVCVFGVFFAPDPPAFVAEMWRLVAPGGALAITTWGPRLFEPGNSMFWDTVNQLEPALFKAFSPWDSLTSDEQLGALFAAAGAARPEIEVVPGRHSLDAPGDFWQVVMGSGYRATVDSLDQAKRAELQRVLVARLEADDVRSIVVDVLYAVARKPR